MPTKNIYDELKECEQKLQESYQRKIIITQKIKKATYPIENLVENKLKKMLQNI